MDLWWIFPVSILFSAVAISSGISGALFFSPFFMLVVGLGPAEAVGAGLLTEVFGMGNGLRLYVRQRVVDYQAARILLAGAVPMVVAGALLAHRLPADTLRIIFGVGLLVLAVFLFLNPAHDPEAPEGSLPPPEADWTEIRSSDGRTYCHAPCSKGPTLGLAMLGGGLTGMISAGLPELSTTQLIVRCRMAPRIAVATSVFSLALTAVVGAGINALAAAPAWEVVRWSIPGVLVGSFVGTRVSKHLPGQIMERVLSVVFGLVGLLVLVLQAGAGG